MKKEFISEAMNRKIEWVEGGRIVHKDLTGNVLAIEPYSKGSLAKIISFLEKKTSKTYSSGMFNRTARDLLNGIEGFRIENFSGSFFGMPACKKTATNKINRTATKYNDIVKMYLPVSQPWKMNMRYQLIIDTDGSVQFEEFETIMPENLNTEYSEYVFSVYECKG